MPATVRLAALPGYINQDDRGRSKTVELLGREFGRETVSVSTVAGLHDAVQAFGARVRAVHPDASFMVSTSIRAGDRKPRGYDAAYLGNGFGQEDFMHVFDRRTTACAALPAGAIAGHASTDAAAA